MPCLGEAATRQKEAKKFVCKLGPPVGHGAPVLSIDRYRRACRVSTICLVQMGFSRKSWRRRRASRDTVHTLIYHLHYLVSGFGGGQGWLARQVVSDSDEEAYLPTYLRNLGQP